MSGHLKKPNTILYGIVFVILIAAIGIWYAVFTLQNKNLRVTFLDVGQGDAIFITAPGGRQMLIDGGPDREVMRQLGNVMPWYDRSIDVVLATHPDKDHIAGLVPVLKRYRAAYVVESGVTSNTPFSAAFTEAEKEEATALSVLARRGMVIDLGRGVQFHILFPDRNLQGVSDTNTSSIIGMLRYGDTEFMLTGDATEAVENYVTSLYGDALASDVLKAGHHGSRTSTGEKFVAAVQPAYAVVSAGKDNSYGHPHKEVVDRLKGVGVEIVGTYENGAVRFVSDGARVWID